MTSNGSVCIVSAKREHEVCITRPQNHVQCNASSGDRIRWPQSTVGANVFVQVKSFAIGKVQNRLDGSRVMHDPLVHRTVSTGRVGG